jgi:modulator of FtsH protease
VQVEELLEPWGDFLEAAAGADGALAGLVFVALSINLERILKLPGVASRAGETLLLLAGSLVAVLLTLMPHESPRVLGDLLFAVGFVVWVVPSVLQVRSWGRHGYYTPQLAAARFLLYQIATVPALLMGFAVMGLLPGGLNWLGAFIVLAIIVALTNAWVLLVEIVR